MLDMKVMKTIFMRGGLHKKGLHTAGINGINKLEQRQMENNSLAKYPEMDSTKNWNILEILYSFGLFPASCLFILRSCYYFQQELL